MKSDLDELWEDWARARANEVCDARCKLRFEVLESLRQMSADQRTRCLLAAIDFASLFDDVDETAFRKMLRSWMANASSDYRKTTLEGLACDPDAWKRWRRD